VPLFLGIFVKKTPSWSGWSTMVVGFMVSILLRILFLQIPPEKFFNSILSPAVSLTKREAGDLNIATTTAVLFIVTFSWFFLTKLFYKKEDSQYVKQVDDFFEEINTPIDIEKEHGPAYDSDSRQYTVLGILCFAYGVFVLLLMLIPNSLQARLCILFSGGVMAVMGFILSIIGFWFKKKTCNIRGESIGKAE
jgi:Na+/proline symporter